MRQSQYFLPTLKEVPTEAQIPSHKLMLRTGMMRQVAAGVFSWLPMGFRVLNKVINVLREELNTIGAQEFLLPALNPIEIWEQTNRVEAMGDVMFHIKNRDGLILAPTHEEIIAYHASQHILSPHQLKAHHLRPAPTSLRQSCKEVVQKVEQWLLQVRCVLDEISAP